MLNEIFQIDLKKLEAIYKGTQLICAFLNSSVTYRQEHSELLSSRSRFWTNILHEPLTKVVLLIGQEKLQLKEQGMIEQLYIISRFILHDRKLFVSTQEGTNGKQITWVTITTKLYL